MDGVSAFSHGESQWITSQQSRDLAHELRASFSAVLIGVNTFLQDNPKLNCRIKTKKKITNKVVILDPEAQSFSLIKKSNLARVRPMRDIYVVSRKKPKTKYPFQLLHCKDYPFNLKDLSKTLYNKNISSVLVEGGGESLSQFLEQKLAKRLYCFISPCLLGGKKGRYWTENLNISGLNYKKHLKSVEILYLNEDFFVTGLIF